MGVGTEGITGEAMTGGVVGEMLGMLGMDGERGVGVLGIAEDAGTEELVVSATGEAADGDGVRVFATPITLSYACCNAGSREEDAFGSIGLSYGFSPFVVKLLLILTSQSLFLTRFLHKF